MLPATIVSVSVAVAEPVLYRPPPLLAELPLIVQAVSIAVRAVSRRDGYEPLARIELFGDLAEYFQGLVKFPEAAREGLTGEQYVRSVLRVIYGGGRG